MTSPLRLRPEKGRKCKLIPIKKRKVNLTITDSLSWKLECLLWLPSHLSSRSDKKKKIPNDIRELYWVLKRFYPYFEKTVVVSSLIQWKLPWYSLWTTIIFTWSSQSRSLWKLRLNIEWWSTYSPFKSLICALLYRAQVIREGLEN